MKLLSKAEVAELLGVCKRQVDRLVRHGRMPVPILLGRLPKWPESIIAAWMAAGCPAADGFEAREAVRAWLP